MNHDRFETAYAAELAKDIAKNPGEYMTPVDGAADLAVRMTASLARGSGQVSNAAKRAAKNLGVEWPGAKTIKEFLTADGWNPPAHESRIRFLTP